jgi:hypothetical protein
LLQPPGGKLTSHYDSIISTNEETTMNYKKPEVSTLGDATNVIELINPAKPFIYFLDGTWNHPRCTPAYDLDE